MRDNGVRLADPATGYVYAMTEGRGLFGSADHGDHWTLLSGNISIDFLLDPNHPNRLYGSAFANALGQNGGVFLSTRGDSNFEQIGLPGMTTSELALNGDGTILYMAVANSGIVTTKLPALP